MEGMQKRKKRSGFVFPLLDQFFIGRICHAGGWLKQRGCARCEMRTRKVLSFRFRRRGSRGGFGIIFSGINDGDFRSLGSIGQALGDEVPSFGQPIADDERFGVGPNGSDNGAVERHFFGFDEKNFIGAAKSVAGNDEDVFDQLAFQRGTDRLADTEGRGG